jgi:hypothetical protein
VTFVTLERRFARLGLELHGWVEEAACVVWESWRGLDRAKGETLGPPWPAVQHIDRELLRAQIWDDLTHQKVLRDELARASGRRQRQHILLRRAIVRAMFPEECLVDGDLPGVQTVGPGGADPRDNGHPDAV